MPDENGNTTQAELDALDEQDRAEQARAHQAALIRRGTSARTAPSQQSAPETTRKVARWDEQEDDSDDAPTAEERANATKPSRGWVDAALSRIFELDRDAVDGRIDAGGKQFLRELRAKRDTKEAVTAGELTELHRIIDALGLGKKIRRG